MAFQARQLHRLGLIVAIAALLLAGGCDRAATLPDPDPTPSGPPPNWAQSYLQVIPLYSVVNQPVAISFSLYGADGCYPLHTRADGCYRQSKAKTSLKGDRILHQYRTWRQGEVCTQAIVPGGFATTLELTEHTRTPAIAKPTAE